MSNKKAFEYEVVKQGQKEKSHCVLEAMGFFLQKTKIKIALSNKEHL